MGNKQTTGQIQPHFQKHCHPQLAKGSINKKQGTIQLYIESGEMYYQWRWNLYPILTYQKHLMLPKYFIDNGFNMVGCRKKENNYIPNMCIGYDPFVYTLQNQVYSRKISHKGFTQRELLKIMKGVLLALREWYHAYKHIFLGSITSRNIIFDDFGHVRLVHLFSFPPDYFISINGVVFQYGKFNTKNTLKGGLAQKIQTAELIKQSLQELGKTLNSAATLQLEQDTNNNRKPINQGGLNMLSGEMLNIIEGLVWGKYGIQDINNLIALTRMKTK